MKTTPVCSILMCLAACALGQEAGPRHGEGEGRSEGGRPSHMPSPQEIWKRMDANGDGAISAEEFSAMPRVQGLPEDKRQKLFERLDKNGDGRISRDELALPDHGEPGMHKMPLPRIWELDKDGDGGVSFEEFKSGQLMQRLDPERQRQIFSRLDTNGDGRLTPEDRPQGPPPHMRPEGGDGPGQGERHGEGGRPPGPGGRGGEGEHRPNLRAMIGRLDANQDGSVSWEEFQGNPRIQELPEAARRERFKHLDRNGDGQINRQDAPASEVPAPDAPAPAGGVE